MGTQNCQMKLFSLSPALDEDGDGTRNELIDFYSLHLILNRQKHRWRREGCLCYRNQGKWGEYYRAIWLPNIPPIASNTNNEPIITWPQQQQRWKSLETFRLDLEQEKGHKSRQEFNMKTVLSSYLFCCISITPLTSLEMEISNETFSHHNNSEEKYSEMTNVDHFFLTVLGIIVFFMQCGFGFLEAGAVR